MKFLKFVPAEYQIGLIIVLSSLFSCGLSYQPEHAEKYQQYLSQANGRGQFNGNVLIVENGEVVYQGAFGTADAKVGKPLDLNSIFRLASVSKQFTAMAIMILKEEGKLSYDQNIKDFFPELPYEGVTIRHLLHHTSGIPDYISLMDKYWKPELPNQHNHKRIDGNKDAINTIIAHKPEVYFQPGDKWRYSNTGYMLLASIVSKVSGMSFAQFLKHNVFEPVGMNNTVVYKYTPMYDPTMPNRTFSFRKELNGTDYRSEDDNYLNNAAGDGGIYSTIGDLLKWDRILYTDKLVSKETLEEAFTPAVLNNGDTTDYGFGWYIKYNEVGEKIAWHTGGWAGFATYIRREIEDDNCIILLSNNANNYFWPMLTGLNNIMHNEAYKLPQFSIKEELGEIVFNKDVETAVKRYEEIKAEHADDYIFNDNELNVLGYSLLWEAKIDDAIEIFKLNVVEYPDSANGYDSLGDAYIAKGDTTEALMNFRKALELDPSFSIPQVKIDKLEGRNTEPMERLVKKVDDC